MEERSKGRRGWGRKERVKERRWKERKKMMGGGIGGETLGVRKAVRGEDQMCHLRVHKVV